jgi:hypothetical protein
VKRRASSSSNKISTYEDDPKSGITHPIRRNRPGSYRL